jgi:hypothetical protein
MDSEKLLQDIHANLANDVTAAKYLGQTSDPRWRTNDKGFLLYRLYVPDAQDLRLCILKHDHVLASHFGANKTLQLVR